MHLPHKKLKRATTVTRGWWQSRRFVIRNGAKIVMKPCGPHENFTVDKFGLVETISETTNETALKGANQ